MDHTDVMDKIFVDDRGQMNSGSFGELRPHINAGKGQVHGKWSIAAICLIDLNPGYLVCNSPFCRHTAKRSISEDNGLSFPSRLTC